MSKIRLTDANIIHAAFTLRREGDIRGKERLDAEYKGCLVDIRILARDILEGDTSLKRKATGSCTNVSISRDGYSKPYKYFLVWSTGEDKDHEKCSSSGRALLKGNARRRAVRAFKKLSILRARKRNARQRCQDWQGRKRDLVRRRIKDRPDILAKMRGLCEEAMVSPEKAKISSA